MKDTDDLLILNGCRSFGIPIGDSSFFPYLFFRLDSGLILVSFIYIYIYIYLLI